MEYPFIKLPSAKKLARLPIYYSEDALTFTASSDSLVATVKIEIKKNTTHILLDWNDGTIVPIVVADIPLNSFNVDPLLERRKNTIIARHVYNPENGLKAFDKRIEISAIHDGVFQLYNDEIKIMPRGVIYYGDIAFRAKKDGDLIGKGDFRVHLHAFGENIGNWSFDKGEERSFRILENSSVQTEFDTSVNESIEGFYKLKIAEDDFIMGTSAHFTDYPDSEYQGTIVKTIGNGVQVDFIVEINMLKWVEIARPLPNNNTLVFTS